MGNQLVFSDDRLLESAFLTSTFSESAQDCSLEAQWLALEVTSPEETLLPEEEEQRSVPEGVRTLAAFLKRVRTNQTTELVVVTTVTLYKASVEWSDSSSSSEEEEDYCEPEEAEDKSFY